MCYIAFIGHSLHWRYINAALQEYVIIIFNLAASTLYNVCSVHRGGGGGGYHDVYQGIS